MDKNQWPKSNFKIALTLDPKTHRCREKSAQYCVHAVLIHVEPIFNPVTSCVHIHCFIPLVILYLCCSAQVKSVLFLEPNITAIYHKWQICLKGLTVCTAHENPLSLDIQQFSVWTVKWMNEQAILTLFRLDQKNIFALCHSSVASPLKRQLVLTSLTYFQKDGKLFIRHTTIPKPQ